jgi:hypothetical protein
MKLRFLTLPVLASVVLFGACTVSTSSGSAGTGAVLVTCTADNDACASSAECCSNICAADGLCGLPNGCVEDNSPCADPAECCSGVCASDGLCGLP